jgi:hypothetical protein
MKDDLERRSTYALTNTIATSWPFAAAGPAVRSFDSDVVTIAPFPTNVWFKAVIGDTVNSREFEPVPQLAVHIS